MEVKNLDNDIEYLNNIGESLNLRERYNIKLAVTKLLSESDFDKILFWGKIIGTDDNYYILTCINYENEYEFPSKTFYYSNSNYIFNPLSLPNIKKHNLIEHLYRIEFTGNPQFKIFESQEEDNNNEPKEPEVIKKNSDSFVDSSEEEPKAQEAIKEILELDKLSVIVRAIDFDSNVVPMGLFKLIPTHEIRKSENSIAFKSEEYLKLENWMHFRKQTQPKILEKLSKNNSIFNKDIMDSVSESLPKGSFTTQLSYDNTTAFIRSLLWMGAIGFVKGESNYFGWCYIGNGLKNENLCFMLN